MRSPNSVGAAAEDDVDHGSLILRALSARTHLHQFRIEAAQHIHQIGLRGHNRVDVFVNSGNFIESCAQQGDVTLGEQFLHGAPVVPPEA